MKNSEIQLYNRSVKNSYFAILEYCKLLVASLIETPLRQTMERENNFLMDNNSVKHEFITPLTYLRLECSNKGRYFIHYGYEQTDRFTQYYMVTSAFIRSIYFHTSKENTEINIEECVHTDWVITNCAELFEYVGDRNKYHQVRIIEFVNVQSRTLIS